MAESWEEVKFRRRPLVGRGVLNNRFERGGGFRRGRGKKEENRTWSNVRNSIGQKSAPLMP